MALEINTCSLYKQEIIQPVIPDGKMICSVDYAYHSEPEDLSPTSSWGSRRSSFSSMASFNSNRHELRHTSYRKTLARRSLPIKNERVTYLEQYVAQLERQLEENRYQQVFESMSKQIDQFVQSRPVVEECITEGNGTFDDGTVYKLQQLKGMISQDSKQEEPIHSQLIDYIDNWISTTAHKYTKEEINALNRLSKDYNASKRKLRQLPRLEHQVQATRVLIQQKKAENKDLRLRLKESEADRNEIEQVLEDIRLEMEVMISEMNEMREERDRYQSKSDRLERDLIDMVENEEDEEMIALQGLLRESEVQVETLELEVVEQSIKINELTATVHRQEKIYKEEIEDYQEEVDLLNEEKGRLVNRLKSSERSLAELELLMEVEKAKQRKSSDSTVSEHKLLVTITERDYELSELKLQIEKHQVEIQALRNQYEIELQTRELEMKSQYEIEYKKQSDIYQVQHTREVRNMATALAELEAELEVMEEQKHHLLETIQQSQAQKRENELQSDLNQSKLTINQLEEEALILYKKNLTLAQQLSELDAYLH
ncbi:hypothetical protein BDB01DRAFT_838596 [Pilobolus umbonatus]|nr:hypothetical protein BDB01DRAFT_838596 [Pilobolus umbonatus]